MTNGTRITLVQFLVEHYPTWKHGHAVQKLGERDVEILHETRG
jgi:hypothetical protein